uniref:WH2 domain-containing protein n=1 Tax=Parastrongyloides trichosuri TaxID=131310 RepID=A0A0N4ZB88_PARTI
MTFDVKTLQNIFLVLVIVMASFSFVISVLYIKLKMKYNKLKANSLFETGISVTKISKRNPTISLDVFKTPRRESYEVSGSRHDLMSMKSSRSTPLTKNTLDPKSSDDEKRRSSCEVMFTKNSARSLSEVFENLNAMRLEKITSNENKTVDNKGEVVVPSVKPTQPLTLHNDLSKDLSKIEKGIIINKALQKVKPDPKERILKKIDSSIIMLHGEPIYNITKNSVKPGDFKLEKI